MKKIKVIDLTIRQIIELCDKHNDKCSECPLFNSILNCQNFNSKYSKTTYTYNREILENEEVELNDKED